MPRNAQITTALFLAMAFSLFARNMPLVGAYSVLSQCMATTNSIFADATIEDGIIVSHSSTDTQISLSPPASIRDFLPGTMTIAMSAITSCSNSVGVLFGDCDAPALTVECDGEWHILPNGVLRNLSEPQGAATVATNRMEATLRVSAAGKVSFASVKAASGDAPLAVVSGIAQPGFMWNGANLPQSWQGFSVRVAGQSAQLLELSLCYSRDGTGLLAR